jgi:hypothetical protein
MIAELFPHLYDVHGRKVFRPGRSEQRTGFRPTFPMARNLTQPLKCRCSTLDEIREFLLTCRRSDADPFAKRDYWQPPEELEKTRTGDCVDLALWTWRQLLEMGYAARFTGGKAGRYGEGHAWVTFEKDGKFYLLEPQLSLLGLRMPRISTLRYHPTTSVAWDGEKISYYAHEKRDTEPPLRILPGLVWEWIAIWIPFWARTIPRILIAIARRIPLGRIRR